MKRRGGGSIFKRGGAYWLKFYRDGQPIRESVAKSLGKLPDLVTEKDASALLNKRLGAIAGGQPIAIGADRVRIGALLDDLLTEYTANGRRSIKRARFSVLHLRPFFGDARAHTLTTASVREYMARRQAAGASNATINRELAALRRALTLAVQGRKILMRPYIPMLQENNARQGFFERDQLEPGTTKNGEGRTFHFTPELRALLEAQRECTAAVQAKTDRIIPHVFHRDGDPIKSFRGSWFAACDAAHVPGRIFHDLRRTAVRNLERAGVPRSVAMKLTGHKTEAVYRRYAIVSDADLRDAADKLAAIAGPGTGTTTGTVTMIRRAAAETVSAQPSDLVAEGEGFEPPRASRPGGFQVHCLAS
jgi:integrase